MITDTNTSLKKPTDPDTGYSTQYTLKTVDLLCNYVQRKRIVKRFLKGYWGGVRNLKTRQETASAPSPASNLEPNRIYGLSHKAFDKGPLLLKAYLHIVKEVSRVFLRGLTAMAIAGFFFLRRLIVRWAM